MRLSWCNSPRLVAPSTWAKLNRAPLTAQVPPFGSGDVEVQGVEVAVQGGEVAVRGGVAPKVPTTSATNANNGPSRARWSAIWAQRRLASRGARKEPLNMRVNAFDTHVNLSKCAWAALPRVGEFTVALPQSRRSLRVRRLDAARLRARVRSRIRVDQHMDTVGEDARGDQQNHDDSIPRFWHGHQPPSPHASTYEQKAPSPQGPGASAPATGFEPVTVRLTVGCSAVELRRIATREDISRDYSKLASQIRASSYAARHCHPISLSGAFTPTWDSGDPAPAASRRTRSRRQATVRSQPAANRSARGIARRRCSRETRCSAWRA